MRAVTMREVTEWVEKNEHHTWSIDDGGGFDPSSGGSPIIKYLSFNLDTRDMKIFRISCDRLEGSPFDFRNEGEGSILDAMDRSLKKRCQK
jgi:hypothetical protein